MSTAVLLLAYGGPDSLDDVPAYLLDIRGGRETPETLVTEISHRYELIGGRSPLKEITERVAARLQTKLELPVYVGMRHWPPRIQTVVERMVCEDDIDHIIAIVQAPHYSSLSVGQYRRVLNEALARTQHPVSLQFVSHWHTEEAYIDGIAANTRKAWQEIGAAGMMPPKLIFTAHSLPAFILEQGDPYDSQLRETSHMLADRLQVTPDRWLFCYQSAAQTGVPWLGPQLEHVVADMAREGEEILLVVPIGFLADHVEVLYDIDIEARQIAQSLGMTLHRPPMLNDGDALIEALSNLVRGELAKDHSPVG